MTVQLEAIDISGAVEQALTEHPVFGDSAYILRELSLRLEHRLQRMAGKISEAAELLEAIRDHADDAAYPVVANTIIRCAILHAHTQFEDGTAFGLPLRDCADVFAAASERIRRGAAPTTLEDGSLPRLGPGAHLGSVWSDEHPDDVFGRAYRRLLQDRYQALPFTPTDDDVSSLRHGAALLEELLPSVGRSALRHAHFVACVPDAGGWTGVASSSQFHLGGTIFLGAAFRTSPWWVAEHLFHEALHQKLYDFRHGHLLLESDFAPQETPAVWSPWNPPRLAKANLWDVHRVYAAFHVYVHIALLATIAERRAAELVDRYGPFRGMTESRKALDRAHYLGEQLLGPCGPDLGAAGRQMAEWLMAVLDVLNPAPPPPGAFVHLCLDRYERETNQVAGALGDPDTTLASAPERLLPLARTEIEATRQVLTSLGATDQLRRFQEAVAAYAEPGSGASFPELRRQIKATLEAASYDRYRISESGHEDDLVRDMIDSQSAEVYSLLAGVPASVVRAKHRAVELRFTKSCHESVGELLAVLACTVPSGGRVLEIGTGTGVGLAWLTSGLGERDDVEVVSLEADPRLSDAARGLGWPAGVRILTADAVSALGELGSFDLVFADAAPVKYGHLDRVLAALRPGGFLVVDDLDRTPDTTPQQQAEKDSLRRSLLRHPELRAVELDESTGVLVAARARLSPRSEGRRSGG